MTFWMQDIYIQTQAIGSAEMKDQVVNIKKFNQFVERAIRDEGTCKMVEQTNGRIAVFEASCYRADDSIDGFIGWWDDDHSQITHADTPMQVYLDMP